MSLIFPTLWRLLLSLWKAMTSVGSVLKLLEMGGLVNFYRFKSPWLNSVQEYYVRYQNGVTFLFIVAHGMSTLARSRRYGPEFYQAMFEDIGMIIVFSEIQVLRKKYRQLAEFADLMETSFSSDDQDVVEACRFKVGIILSVLFFGMGPTIACAWVETLLPITQEEKEIRRYVYRVKYPEKRHPSNIWVPGVDESEKRNYEMIFCFQVYMGFVMCLIFSCTSAVVPIITVYIQGQYAILCKRIDQYGKSLLKDKDSLESNLWNDQRDDILWGLKVRADGSMLGDFFFNTGRNNVRSKPKNILTKYKHQDRIIEVKTIHQEERIPNEKQNAEIDLRDIIEFHQRILILQKKMMFLCTPIIALVIVSNTLCPSFCLFQLTSLGGTAISKLRLVKFCGEILVSFLHYFYLCHCSELLDESARQVNRAVYNLNWYQPPAHLRKDILFLLRCTQQSNYLKFSHGLNHVFRRESFIQMCKVAYKFVNFMRIKNADNYW